MKGSTALGLEALGRLRVGRIFGARSGEGTLAQSGTRPRVSPGEEGETAQSQRGRAGHAQVPVLVSGSIKQDLSPVDFLAAQRVLVRVRVPTPGLRQRRREVGFLSSN